MNKFRSGLIAWLPVLGMPLLLFLPTLLAGKALFWGTPMLQFVPWWDLAWSQVRAGHLPLWNPYLGMGTPLLANYQSALFYPPHWIYFILHLVGGRLLMAWGMALMVAVHLGWAGLGMALLVRRLRLGLLSQAVAGLAFGMCGYLVARAGFLSINAAAAWIPWILLCLTPPAWGERNSFLQKLALIGCLALQLLAGHAQTTWYSWLLAGMWAVYLGWVGAYHPISSLSACGSWKSNLWQGIKKTGLPVRLLAIGLLTALALAALQLLPTLEYLRFSNRAGEFGFEQAMTYSFWPWRLLGLVAPDLFGNPAQGDYWGYANFWEDAIYVGVLPLILGFSCLLGAFRRRSSQSFESGQFTNLREFALSRKFSRFLWFLIIISLLLALGDNTPLVPWLYRHIPGFDLFQAPSRYLIWLEFALCLAAAVGVETWKRPEKRRLYWTRLATAGALAVTLGAGLAWYILGDLRPTFVRATALAGLWGMGVGLLSLSMPKVAATESKAIPGAGWWQWLVVLLVSVDLFIAGYGLNPAIDLAAYRLSPEAASIGLQLSGHRLYIPPQDEHILKYGRLLRFDSFITAEDWMNFGLATLPNMNLFGPFSSANNFDPLEPGIYALWMQNLERVPNSVLGDLYRLMDIGKVGVYDKKFPHGVHYSLIPGGRRVRWVACWIVAADPQEALQLVSSGKVDFESQVVLEASPVISQTCDHEESAVKVEIKAEGPLKIIITLDAPQNGYLVLSDTWFPGWKATVNGRPVPILRANYLFRGLPVESGPHEVVFQYRPFSFYLGFIVTACTLIIMVIFVLRKRHLEKN